MVQLILAQTQKEVNKEAGRCKGRLFDQKHYSYKELLHEKAKFTKELANKIDLILVDIEEKYLIVQQDQYNEVFLHGINKGIDEIRRRLKEV